ncbi:MAG: DNA topoisomerase VI subunit B, partial [Candidatus Heimdallarchaeota archaeon]|nr:DNA topoisomerase VI subunit B [Candidatus Heimdallarchaeota archaeon]
MIAKEKIVERSAAEFFEANKAIAGFDNPTRSTYTSVRELVENALDAAEKGGFLPEIHVTIELMSPEEINDLMGVKSFEIGEDASYEFLRLTVRDNGIGIKHEDIPQLFGRVLTGSNFGERQSRGRFGLGAKMVLIYSQSTIHVPFEIKSRHAISKKKSASYTSHYELFIDITENAPEIVTVNKLKGKKQLKTHGTEVSVCFAGTWGRARRYIYEYFKQMAVITPYATFHLTTPDDPEPLIHERTVDIIPPLAQEVSLHPMGTDINQLKSEISRTTCRNMNTFLKEHFQRVGDKTAEAVLEAANISADKSPHDLNEMELRRLIHEGFTKVRFLSPDGQCLSPLGHKNLAAGLEDVYQPEFVCSDTRSPASYSGHAFQVEVAIGYGGEKLEPPYELLRFANRIPLLFGEGNDLIKKTIEEINWTNYKTNINRDPLVFAVSLVSTKIPFPETSKEYIAEVNEISKELRLCLQSAGRKLLRFQRALRKKRRAAKRMKVFEKYAPVVSSIVGQMLGEMDEESFPFLFSPTQFTNCLKQREGSVVLPRNPIPVESLPYESIEGVNLERYDIQTLQDLLLLDEEQLKELYALGLSEDAVEQAEQILGALLELPELAKDELMESTSAKALTEFAKERGILAGIELYNGDDELTTLPGIGPATERSLKRRGIRDVKQFFIASNKELTTVSGLTIGIVTDIKTKCSVDVLPNIPSQTVEELHEKKIYSVLDFIQRDDEELLKIYGLSDHRVSSLKELVQKQLDLSLEELREGEKEEELEEEEIIEEAKKEEKESLSIKEKLPPPPADFLPADAPVEELDGIGATMAQRLKKKGIEDAGKFYMVKTSRLLDIKGLGTKTIAKNRGNIDVIVLPRINFEGKLELNLMEVFTTKQFLETEDDLLTNVKGLRTPTISKLKQEIEEKLLMTPGSKAKQKTRQPSKKKPAKTKSVKAKSTTAKKDKSIAEYLGTKQPKQKAKSSASSAEVAPPPDDLLDPQGKITVIKGVGKKTAEKFSKLGVSSVGDLFEKDLTKLTKIPGFTEKDIIDLRKRLSVEVLPYVTDDAKQQLYELGIYTVKQFQNARIATT